MQQKRLPWGQSVRLSNPLKLLTELIGAEILMSSTDRWLISVRRGSGLAADGLMDVAADGLMDVAPDWQRMG
jgi:hypothetical protein